MNATIQPNLFILTYKQEDGSWAAWGSRKVNFLDLEAKIDDGIEVTYRGGLTHEMSPSTLREFIFNGSIRNLTTVTGNSELGAVGGLIDALRKEEEEELRASFEREKYKDDIKRFGGQVDEELIRKVVRWRKKQAKKKAEQDELDERYHEWG